MRLGFIGLGRMGHGMAANLLKAGHPLVVHDLSQEAVAALVARGATRAASVAEVAACDLVFTSLPTPADVMSVADGDGGLVRNLSRGAVWFDLTTNALDVVRDLHRRLAANDVHFLDAPVSGGPAGAESGRLAILVGGDREVFLRHRPVLDAMADQVRYIDAIGSGTVVKLAHNLASTAIKAVVAEVLTLGVKAGVDPLTLWEGMRSGAAGRMRGFDNVQRFLQGDLDPPSFALRLLDKDVRLATAMAEALGVPLPMCGHLTEDLAVAMDRGWADRDSQAILLLQQERAGIAPIKVDRAAVQAVLARS